MTRSGRLLEPVKGGKFKWYNTVRSKSGWNFIQIVSAMNDYWVETTSAKLGLNGDVNPTQLNFYYYDPDNQCA